MGDSAPLTLPSRGVKRRDFQQHLGHLWLSTGKEVLRAAWRSEPRTGPLATNRDSQKFIELSTSDGAERWQGPGQEETYNRAWVKGPGCSHLEGHLALPQPQAARIYLSRHIGGPKENANLRPVGSPLLNHISLCHWDPLSPLESRWDKKARVLVSGPGKKSLP